MLDSFKRFTIFLAFLIVLGISTIYIFDLLVAEPINLPLFLEQAFDIIIIVGFWLTIILLFNRAKPFLSKSIGSQAATILLYALYAVAAVVMIFGVLNTLGVSPVALLASSGIITITVGLIISTFVGSILAGALVFSTHKFRVGDIVLVNNIPGKVINMTALVTRIETDVGQITIPNSAIASGGVIMTAVHKYEAKSQSRLPYALGDRVVSSNKNEEGTVTGLTPLQTTILLDSGKELTFLNNSILAGTVAAARVAQTKETKHK
jgi:small-conductance mechanosensitive channel